MEVEETETLVEMEEGITVEEPVLVQPMLDSPELPLQVSLIKLTLTLPCAASCMTVQSFSRHALRGPKIYDNINILLAGTRHHVWRIAFNSTPLVPN